MIVSISGLPGIGKFSTGLALVEMLRGRLLDNHTLFNVGLALADVGSADLYRLCREVREIAFRRVLELPSDIPIVLTGMIAHGGAAGFAEEHWGAIRTLAKQPSNKLFAVTLTCATDQLKQRMENPDRKFKRKMGSALTILRTCEKREFFDDGADHKITIDNTYLRPMECALAVADWIRASNE